MHLAYIHRMDGARNRDAREMLTGGRSNLGRCPGTNRLCPATAWDRETIENKQLGPKPANLVPHPQWDREPIDNIAVVEFFTAKIADFKKLFSRLRFAGSRRKNNFKELANHRPTAKDCATDRTSCQVKFATATHQKPKRLPGTGSLFGNERRRSTIRSRTLYQAETRGCSWSY